MVLISWTRIGVAERPPARPMTSCWRTVGNKWRQSTYDLLNSRRTWCGVEGREIGDGDFEASQDVGWRENLLQAMVSAWAFYRMSLTALSRRGTTLRGSGAPPPRTENTKSGTKAGKGKKVQERRKDRERGAVVQKNRRSKQAPEWGGGNRDVARIGPRCSLASTRQLNAHQIFGSISGTIRHTLSCVQRFLFGPFN